MNKALETYEKNIHLAGKAREGEEVLLPIAHMVFKAQLEITINQEGNFITAVKVEKRECSTLIPVTESSGGRSSGIAPHPLNDTLSYIAGDYSKYSEKDYSQKYQRYMENLKKWVVSEFSHPKIKAIYTYAAKEKIIKDLIACGQVNLTEEGKFDNQKIQGADYEKTLVRFRVIDAANPSDIDATWEDTSLMEAYSKFYASIQSGKTDICYLTGEKAIITENHPKGVLLSNYSAKLISANDTANFTFRGRFAEPSEACAVSYEASQKVHAALSWLSRNQGVTIGNKDKCTYICWRPGGKKVKVFKKSIAGYKDDDEEKMEEEPTTLPEFQGKLKKAFLGYAEELEKDNEDVVIIGLDAATTGRLSVTYYSELNTSDFLKYMKEWEESCKWYYFNRTGKPVLRTPNILQIVKSAFGTEQGKFLELDEKILKKQVERLIGCMTQNLPLPFDLVYALYIKASSLQLYANWRNREGVLSTACALITKFYNDSSKKKGKGEKFHMNLDENMRDRSYQFGRLLAVLEKVEKYVLYKKKGKKKEEEEEDETNTIREANAIRLQSAFVSHPMTTWKVLEERLIPYYQQISAKKEEFYKGEISEIISIVMEDYRGEAAKVNTELNKPLKETYLLGYYWERKKLNTRKEEEQQEVNSNGDSTEQN